MRSFDFNRRHFFRVGAVGLGTVAVASLSMFGGGAISADQTLTITATSSISTHNFSYTVVDGVGNVDVGFITANTVATATNDGIVSGTGGNDLITATSGPGGTP